MSPTVYFTFDPQLQNTHGNNKNLMTDNKTTRLDQRPPFFFANLFDEANVRVQPAANVRDFDVSKEATHVATLKIGAPEFDFEVLLRAHAAGVDEQVWKDAREVILELGAMDAVARAPIEGNDDPEEGNLDTDIKLMAVHIGETQVELHYYWLTVNADFCAYYTLGDNNAWTFDGT